MEPKSKLERQLVVLHIFHFCQVTEFIEITSIIRGIKKRTVVRDIAELRDAGLLNVAFSRKYNGFVHKDPKNLHNHSRILIELIS